MCTVEVGVDGGVHVHLRLTLPSCMMVGLLVPQIEDRVQVLPGLRSVEVTHDTGTERRPQLMREDLRRRRAEALAR